MRELRVAAFAGLAFWTRMDAVLSCAPALVLVLWKLRDRKRLGAFLGFFCAMAGALLLARRWYYGDWLPNTYYLKIAGWPLGKRLAVGLFQNLPTLKWVVLGGLAFVLVAWRSLEPADRPVLLGLLPLLLTLGYSSQERGRFLWQVLGYDRHAASALPLFVFTVAAVMLCARGSPRRLLLSRRGRRRSHLRAGGDRGGGVRDEALGSSPESVGHLAPVPARCSQEVMIVDGQMTRGDHAAEKRVSRCVRRGATIYFSRRGGVDILGKSDTYVSHLPAADEPGEDSRCFRKLAPSGHNKEDVPGLFALRRPEVSIVLPPANVKAKYVSFVYQGRLYYGIRKSSAILWSRVTDVQAL